MLLFFLCSLYSSVSAAKIPESQPSASCEAQYDTLKPHAHPLHNSVHEGEHGDFPLHSARASIAIVTMADTRNVPLPKNLAYLSDIKPGALVNILDVVWRNRQEYADRHGYTLINGTELVGKDRPPSWYKLKIVESVIDEYDWVFYLDPDAWITNPEIPLEAVLPAPGGPDFVVTEDATGANAGSWIIRSSDWSREFLAEWWGMDSFIRPAGDTKSGDNDALKHYLAAMNPDEKARRIAVPPQCALNSYLWRPSARQWMRWFTSYGKIHSGIWRPGHLLVHLAGWDNYKGLMRLQKLFVNSHDLTRRSSSGLPLPQISRKHLMPDWRPADVPQRPFNPTDSTTSTSVGTSQGRTSTKDSKDSEDSASSSSIALNAGMSLRRRASALLSSPTNIQNSTSPNPQRQAGASSTPTIPTGLRSKPLVATFSDYQSDEHSADDSDDAVDYTVATDAEIADLGLSNYRDEAAADDMEMLDMMLNWGGAGDDTQSEGHVPAWGDAEEHPTFEHHHQHHHRPHAHPPRTHTAQKAKAEFKHSDNTIVTLEHGSDETGEHEDAHRETDLDAEEDVPEDERDEDLVMEIADELAGILNEHKQKNLDSGSADSEVSSAERGRRGVGADLWAITEDTVPSEHDDVIGFPGDDTDDPVPTKGQPGTGVPAQKRVLPELDIPIQDDIVDTLESSTNGQGRREAPDLQAGRRSHLLRNANRIAGTTGANPNVPQEQQQQGRGRSLLQISDDAKSLFSMSFFSSLMTSFMSSDVNGDVTTESSSSSSSQSTTSAVFSAFTDSAEKASRREDSSSSSTPQQTLLGRLTSFTHTLSSVKDHASQHTQIHGTYAQHVQDFETQEPTVTTRDNTPTSGQHAEDVQEYFIKLVALANNLSAESVGDQSPLNRHSILDMSTEEIDALEENTYLSSAEGQQLVLTT